MLVLIPTGTDDRAEIRCHHTLIMFELPIIPSTDRVELSDIHVVEVLHPESENTTRERLSILSPVSPEIEFVRTYWLT